MMNVVEKQEQQEEIKFWSEMEELLDADEVIVTRHGRKRVRERICKSKSLSNIEKAFRLGITEHQATGQLRKYMEKKRLKKGTADNIRVFHQHVFLFAGSVLITVFRLPNRLLKTEAKVKSKLMQCAS